MPTKMRKPSGLVLAVRANVGEGLGLTKLALHGLDIHRDDRDIPHRERLSK